MRRQSPPVRKVCWRCCGNRCKRRTGTDAVTGKAESRAPVEYLSLNFMLTEKMKEPDDQDADGEKSDRSKSDRRQSHSSRSPSGTAVREDHKSIDNTIGEGFTEGEESYIEDDESYVEGSSSSLQDDYAESLEESRYMETPAPDAEEAEEEVKRKISESFFYDYMELVSMPFVTPDSNIPLDLLTLVDRGAWWTVISGVAQSRTRLKRLSSNSSSTEQLTHRHSFGYDSRKRANLKLLESSIVMYIAGNQLIFLNLKTKEQSYLRSSSGIGIGVTGVHPDKTYFTVAEKGVFPKIIIYEYPSMRPYRILQDGTDLAYAYVDFNFDGTLLASVGGSPDHTLTIWNWKEEKPILRTKAFSQEVFKVTFNPEDDEQLTTSGSGHIKFWQMALTFTGLKLQGSLGRFGKTATTDIEGYMELPDGKVLSGSEWGNMLLWEGGHIKVELSRAAGKPCHQGPINQIMLDEGEVITIGSDGCVRIWDFETIDTADVIDETGLLEIEPINELQVDKNVKLFSMIKMNEVGNNFWLAQDSNGAIWKLDLSFSNIISYGGAQITAGFEDGVVRILELYDPKGLTVFVGRKKVSDADIRLKQVFKPHTAAVTALAYDCDGEVLATGSKDKTVFFFEVERGYKPIGYITTPGPVCQLTWSSSSHPESTLLIICEDGYVLEAPFPAIKEDKEDRDVVSYEIKDMCLKYFHFTSVKSKILGGYDSGFLYHCEFPPDDKSSDNTVRKDEPFDFRLLEDTEDNPITTITFSINREMMFCGMQNGAIRVYILSKNDSSLTSMEDYWQYNVHDNNYGRVNAISTSFDDRFLVTAGADSNIFVFNIFSEFELKKVVKAKVPSPRFGIETEPIPEDIEDPKAYSIENARRKREHDKLMKKVEEIKAGKREQIKALRNQLQKLLQMNEELPKHMQFKRTDFDLDSKIRAEIGKKTANKIQRVEKELAWEKEKHQVSLKKLQNRFRHSLENDIIVVHAIQSDHKISSYRLVKPSKYSKTKRASQSERRPSKFERFEKEGTGRKDSQRDTGGSISVPEESVIEKGKKFRPKTLSEIMVENQIEKTRKLILKAERAQMKIQQRKKEWEELYKSKPDDGYEDPKDVQAIKEAQLFMGDFNLKTASDYKIPEHMRINAAKKEEELGYLDSMAYSKKMHMNKSIISLRDLKVAVIEEIQCLVQELKNIQSTLPIFKHLPIPQVPQIYPEEVPEKRFQYDDETLLAFKQQQQVKSQDGKAHQVGQTAFAGSAGGFLRLSSGKEGDLTTRDSLSRASKASAFSLDLPKFIEFEKADPTDVELEIMKREEIKHVYMQQYLINRIKELIVTFDAELRLLRHQKLKLDTQMKLSDLHHVTLFQEMLLLKNFEKQENILQERVNSLDKEEQDMQWKINETLKEMEEKKNEVAKLQDQEKALYAGFQTALGENNKFANFLMKVLKKRIKRVKKKEVEGDVDEEEESEESSEEESSLESDEDESGSEDEVFDDSICPTNCDIGLFELALQLREKRLDIEEALVEEKKMIDNLKKEHDTLSKKVKIVATNLNAAEEALEAYQREKQQRLNELLVVIPLKLHQIEYVLYGEIPSDLSGSLVFSNRSLGRLQERIVQLHEENSKQQKLNKECRERRKQLIREKREMAKTIQKMEETVSQLMISKFGRVINLEALQTLSVNTTLEELKIKKLRKELSNVKEMKMWEEKIAQVRWELMMKTKEHTKKLHQMNDLCIEKQRLDSRLNTLQNQQSPRICFDENTTDIQHLKGQNQKPLPPFPDLSLTDLKTLQVDVSSNAQTES
ncbi:hypothetical protein MG293_000737 [Ovis ammon polii]|uniref:Cilia- and flagella-associated protein 44 n=1 Tax=Ovis ammon polii TaxID=230172 RepID=A0AAD4UP83_OVIAM|nr:hypothetical protein MG293_000737 [Ovis ammon polii]